MSPDIRGDCFGNDGGGNCTSAAFYFLPVAHLVEFYLRAVFEIYLILYSVVISLLLLSKQKMRNFKKSPSPSLNARNIIWNKGLER